GPVTQLEVSERRADVGVMRGGLEHHWLRLYKSDDAGIVRVGYKAASDEVMEEIASRLDDRKIEWTSGGDLGVERVDRWIRFHDLDGFEIEVFNEMVEMPVPPHQALVHMRNLRHAVILVSSPLEASRFYQEVLGFRVSDWVER